MSLSSAEVVKSFLEQVRSGKDPDAAYRWMEEVVIAHQVNSENETTVLRSPGNYADHVREMIATFGRFQLDIQELIAQDDRVYVRWRQTGKHFEEISGYAPTGSRIIEIASAVYRVSNGKIVEYWIQVDREGIRAQLELHSNNK